MTKEKIFTEILGQKELEIISIESLPKSYKLRVRSVLGQNICPKCGKTCSKVKSYTNQTIRPDSYRDRKSKKKRAKCNYYIRFNW